MWKEYAVIRKELIALFNAEQLKDDVIISATEKVVDGVLFVQSHLRAVDYYLKVKKEGGKINVNTVKPCIDRLKNYHENMSL